jgi:hypothetical protein
MSRMSETIPTASDLSLAVIALMRGVIEREADPRAWQALAREEGAVRDHVAVLGLALRLDEAEGHAYLTQRTTVEGEAELPRLVPRRPLSYPVSLMLALLRRKLVEHDATSGERRLILARDDIAEMVALFLADASNQARQQDRIDGDIRRIVEMGFLRKLRGQTEQYEVQRILTAFVDAQWLGRLAERLTEYRVHAT